MNQDINSAWSAVVPILRKLDFYDINNIVGFDRKILNRLGYYENWGKTMYRCGSSCNRDRGSFSEIG